MSYNEASQFAGYFGRPNDAANMVNAVEAGPQARNEQMKNAERAGAYFHGEALARDAWAERYGHWIVLGFSALFALFLIMMDLLGQVPGKSFSLKGASDILQFVGEGIGLVFCTRIALRLRKVSSRMRRELIQGAESLSPNELAKAHNEAQAARRAFLAWSFLACAIALYATGQAIWTSYDIRMNSADVPFPGTYDIGFVASYPFFLIGTLMLTRRKKASVGRLRLVLDALAVIGTSLALSWFFLLNPLLASLAQAPSIGAAVLSIYFPTGDLFLVAVGALLMFSPLANRSQQSVFGLLCMGLFFLAVTDSLLAYYSLSSSFNTGTLQDVLWPLSLSLIGLAAIEYPRSMAREQEQAERLKGNPALLSIGSLAPTRLSQFSMTAQTIAPFILVLATCALLLTNIAPHGGASLLQADLVALALVLIVIARQAMTLLENNRLTMQMRGELVIQRRELQVTRREADEATRTAQEKQQMDAGIAALQEVHARVARGDIIARAPTVAGPLLPIAISLNLMLDRVNALSQRGAKYDQLAQECRVLQEGVERLSQGMAPWPTDQAQPQGVLELRSIILGLSHIYRLQENNWRRIQSALESMSNLTRRIMNTLSEMRQSNIFKDQAQNSFERMILERVIREVDLLEQQQGNMMGHVFNAQRRSERNTQTDLNQGRSEPGFDNHPQLNPAARPAPNRTIPTGFDGQNLYQQRHYQYHHQHDVPIEE